MEKKAPSCMDSQLHFRSGTKKLLIGMVGLPARGKTYISRKLCRYLNWIGYNTQTFVVSEYRRKHYGRHGDHQYFNSENQKALKERTHSAELALNDLVKFLEGDGQVAIYDGTNITQAKRDQVNEVATTNCFQLIWIESICRDKAIVSYYIDEIEARSPDFIEHSDAVREMHKVIEHYEKVYEPIPEDSDLSYVKLIDAGKRVVSNNMGGYLEARMVSFLLNLRLYNKDKVLFISRHGESEYNLDGKIGGDSSITKAGQAYSGHLGEWMLAQPEIQKVKGEFPVWCSTLQRTKQTAGVFKDRAIAWQNLREIDVGICDGMTYEEVEKKYPEEFAARKADKLRYRYPRGESYMDVITRLEPVIFELEKADGPILVIAHRAVLRCLFAYFQDEPASRIPYLDVPLHTVIKLVPKTYSYEKFAEPLGEHIEEKEDGRKSSSQPKPKPPTPRLDTRSHHERAHAHGPSATPTATAATADETADGTAETGSKRKFLGVAFDQASKLEVRGRDDEGVSSPDRREVVAPMALRTGGHHLLLGSEELPSPVALSDSPTSSVSSLSSISTPSPSSASYSPSGTYSPRSLDHAPGLAITVAKIFV